MKTIGLAAMAAAMMAAAGPAMALTASGGSFTYTGPTDFNTQLGLLSRFNGAAGTLNAVTFTYGYGFNSTITVTSSGGTPANGSVATQSALAFDTSDGAFKAILDATVNRTSASIGRSVLDPAAFDLAGSRSSYVLSPGSSTTVSSVATLSRVTTVTDASSLASFYATANSTVFDLYGRTLTGLQLASTGGNAVASQQTTGTATFGISYDYTEASAPAAVPEPATWAMMVGGFGLVGGGLRRRGRLMLRQAG